jgi:uncharacterized GH25 family protein
MKGLVHWCAIACLISLSPSGDAVAHEFWVQPDRYRLAASQPLSLTLQVGEAPERQRSPIPLRRITRFVTHTPYGSTIDLRPTLVEDDAGPHSTVTLAAPGAYVVAVETDNQAYSRSPDGLERYSRAAKAIVQVGARHARLQAHVTKPLGLRLEIVPDISPYSQPQPARFPVRVIYEGRPLPGALIKLIELDRDAGWLDEQLTDRAGRASFRMPATGTWLLHVVWTKQLASSSDADFETVFSSLTFSFAAHLDQYTSGTIISAGTGWRE